MKYCLSKFTRMINAENGDIIIFNTYTGKQNFVFDEIIKRQIEMLRSFPQEEKLIDSRLLSYFCVPEGTDENLLVFNNVNNFLNSSESLSLILFPTLDCNFACTYCYENKEKGFMLDETYDKLFAAIKKHHEENHIKFLKLEWFGGEPLLCYDKLIEFTKEVNDFSPYKGQQTQGEIQTYVCINNQLIKNNASQNIQVNYDGDEMYLKIGGIVEYRICPQENKIYICSTDFAWVESTFLNLPFALFFSRKNMLLLHASSLIYNNIVIPLCAPKGTGKTTVTLGLSKFYPFYSDDTLLLKIENGELNGYYGTKYIKLNKDSYDIMICDDGFEMLYKNVQGKAYVSMMDNTDDDLIRGCVDKMLFLQREGETVSSVRITNKFNKKILLHSNICGSGTLGYEYCKCIEKSSIFKFIIENLEFIKIIFCNNKERIGTTIGEIKEIIEDSIK